MIDEAIEAADLLRHDLQRLRAPQLAKLSLLELDVLKRHVKRIVEAEMVIRVIASKAQYEVDSAAEDK